MMPPGLVTRTISASIACQSGTCSRTLAEKHTSTTPEASGRLSALPTTLPGSGGPQAASSPRSVSAQKARAPAARNARTKNPGPPPTSSTSRPLRSVYWASWRTVSAARTV